MGRPSIHRSPSSSRASETASVALLLFLLPAAASAGMLKGELFVPKGLAPPKGVVAPEKVSPSVMEELTRSTRAKAPIPGYPLPDQKVEVCPSGTGDKAGCFTAYTNDAGKFRVDDVPAGTYDITTEGRGGKPITGKITVPDDRPLDLKIFAP